MLSAKDFLWLALAAGWLLLVLFLGYVFMRLGQVLRSTEELVDGVTERTVPLMGEVTTSVVHVNQQLARVDSITENVQTLAGNAATLSSLFAATLGGPLVKVAAFTYGVRKATKKRHRGEVEDAVDRVLKEQKKARKGR